MEPLIVSSLQQTSESCYCLFSNKKRKKHPKQRKTQHNNNIKPKMNQDHDDKKLKGLKKAYEYIIVNTAREAAARIMASERKSVRLQHELNASKEQAVQMLLRLKQMSDSKIREAETSSRSKQMKIEELEAQLREAEDIVKDLRDELRGAQNEVERVRKCQSKEKTPEVTSSATVYVEKSALDKINEAYNTYQDDLDNVESDHVVKPDTAPIQGADCPSHLGNTCMSRPKLPSTGLGSKGSYSYRKKRSERIREFEEKIDAGELAFSETINEIENGKTGDAEEIIQNSGQGSTRGKPAMPAAERVNSQKRKRKSTPKRFQPLAGERNLSGSVDLLDLLCRVPLDMSAHRYQSEVLRTIVGSHGALPGDSEKADVAAESSNEVVAVSECEPPKKSPATFKYTFQRRKKKGASNAGIVGAASGENMVVNDIDENQNDPRETTSLAHQLVSMSERNGRNRL